MKMAEGAQNRDYEENTSNNLNGRSMESTMS